MLRWEPSPLTAIQDLGVGHSTQTLPVPQLLVKPVYTESFCMLDNSKGRSRRAWEPLRAREAKLISHYSFQVLHPGRSVTKSDFLPISHSQVGSVLLRGCEGAAWPPVRTVAPGLEF